jgi:hypothetical protein
MGLRLVNLFFCLCVVSGGCDGGRPNRDALSPAEYFNKTQGNTMTPHGRIKAGSGSSIGNGKITYQTEDGTTWEVMATPDGNGFRYSDPKAANTNGR